MVALDTPVVTYQNDNHTILIGLETQNLGSSDPQNTQSFYSSGQEALDYQAQLVYNEFGANGLTFGGFAIDNYADFYLSGTGVWPSTNPTLPSSVSVQPVSGGVPTYASIATTSFTITFPNNSNPNATVTVTPLNPAAQIQAPNGFLLTNLAFDISTTAVFTGPVTVCFTVPSLDPATFANLRVLHYVGGVAFDQTITSGPNAPNPVTQTICASVTSFSPFVLAKLPAAPKSGTNCNGVYDGIFNGNVTVSTGQICSFTGGGITGNVTQRGGKLVLSNARIGGNVQIGGNSTFAIGPGSTIAGNFLVGNLPLGSNENQVCGSTVRGNLQVESNSAPVQIGSAATMVCAGNTIAGNLQIQNDFGTTATVGNKVGGNLQDQNNQGLTQGSRTT